MTNDLITNYPVYFDNAATTQLDPRVLKVMIEVMQHHYGNPASRSHAYGWAAEKLIEKARSDVAALINADPKEIIWTSGATEADNLAIKGVAGFYKQKGQHIVTVKTEHKAVLDTCRHLERFGYEVTYLTPKANGSLDLAQLEAALRDDTILVSVMHANNEIGVIQDIAAIGKITRERGIIFHVDAAQSAGKIPVDVIAAQVDLMSLSAHKVYGPKGMGALYVGRNPRIRLEAQMHGGGHERGMRSGSLATHQIVGMGEAFALAKQELALEAIRIKALRDKLWQGCQEIEEIKLNGDAINTLPGILNVSFSFIEGESLLMALKDLAISSGSACTSASLEPSYVLRALGLEDEAAHSSIRFSLGRFTTEQDIDFALQKIKTAVEKLRNMSPLWEMYKEGIDLSKVQWAAH